MIALVSREQMLCGIGNGKIVVGQKRVHAHFQEFDRFFRIIGKEEVATDIVSVCFVDQRLIIVGREKLDFAALIFNGPVHNFPALNHFLPIDIDPRPHATGDFRGDLQSPFHDFRRPHEIDVFHVIVFPEQVNDLPELIFRIGRTICRFDVEIDDDLPGELGKDFFERRDLCSFITFSCVNAEIQCF